MGSIKLKRSNVHNKVPGTSDLGLGEVGINTYDGKLFIKRNDGTDRIIEIGNSIVITDTGNSSYTPDFNSSNYFEYTMDQNTTINNPTNFEKGDQGVLILIQDSTGGYTASWGTYWIFPNGSPSIGTSANDINIFKFVVVSSTKIYIEFKATV